MVLTCDPCLGARHARCTKACACTVCAKRRPKPEKPKPVKRRRARATSNPIPRIMHDGPCDAPAGKCGTYAGYVKGGRCPACREARRLYQINYRRRVGSSTGTLVGKAGTD